MVMISLVFIAGKMNVLAAMKHRIAPEERARTRSLPPRHRVGQIWTVGGWRSCDGLNERLGIRHGAEDAALHFDHFQRGEMIAVIRRAGAVGKHQAFITR